MSGGNTRRQVARAAGAGAVLLASTGLATAALVAAGIKGASAGTQSGEIPYTCPVVVSGVTVARAPLDIGFADTSPARAAAGTTFDLTGLQAKATIPAAFVTELVSLLHIKSFGGTVTTLDLDTTGGTPATLNTAGSGDAFTVELTSGEPAVIAVPSSPATVGPFTAGTGPTVKIAPGAVTITTKVGTATASIECTAPSSAIPSSEVATVAVVASSTTTTTVPPTTTTVAATPVTVPFVHTGEPWAGWPYWAVTGAAGLLGAGALELAVSRRRRRR